MIVRDYYFAAWAIDQDIQYRIEGRNVILDCDASCIHRLKVDYRNTAKPAFDRVREIHRLINESR